MDKKILPAPVPKSESFNVKGAPKLDLMYPIAKEGILTYSQKSIIEKITESGKLFFESIIESVIGFDKGE